MNIILNYIFYTMSGKSAKGVAINCNELTLLSARRSVHLTMVKIYVSLKASFVATVSPAKPLQTILQLSLWAAADDLEYCLSFALISRCNAPLRVALVSGQ